MYVIKFIKKFILFYLYFVKTISSALKILDIYYLIQNKISNYQNYTLILKNN